MVNSYSEFKDDLSECFEWFVKGCFISLVAFVIFFILLAFGIAIYFIA